MKPYNPVIEMKLAARTGFLSKKLWTKYFAVGKTAWQNRVWMNPSMRGYFKPHPSSRAESVIVLDRENYFVEKAFGDEITSPPSVAVLDHDEIMVETFLRIDRLDSLAHAKFEAELKRADLRNKRHFDPSDKTKYPDLLIAFSGPNSQFKIAIELELSRKEPKRYRQMMNAYMSNKDVSLIIFVTDLEIVENGIKAAIRDTYYPEWERPVGFVSLKDWLADPMKAAIRAGEKVTCLEAIKTGKPKSGPSDTVSAP
jgi:hypothetical protein